jgi:hypothetical protein
MLHYETVEAQTLELLKSLLNAKAFKELRLVGGAALAMQIGHRKSIDLDLFGKMDADEFEIKKQLNQIGSLQWIKRTININILLINNIKVDLVNYPYPWISQMGNVEGIRLASVEDIGAMKLAAITGRGTKKDFIDLYFLLKKFSMTDLVSFYRQKYADGSTFMVLKSLAYFGDADLDESPVMLKMIEWESVKDSIKGSVENYVKSLSF